jgi:hypothetical protein
MSASFNLKKFASDLCVLLPDWSCKTQPDISKYEYLRHKDGGSITLYYDERSGKIEVTPYWIREGSSTYPSIYGPNKVVLVDAININPNRSLESIAKDVQKRLLTPYLPLFAKGLAEKAVYDEYYAKKQLVVNEFATILNRDIQKYQFGNDEITSYLYPPGTTDDNQNYENGIGVEIRVHGNGTVNFHLQSLPVEVAKKILEMFPKLPADKNTP